MQCWLLLKDAEGRLPTPQELRRLGFRVSTAVLPESAPEGQGLAQAAESPAPYGGGRQGPETAGPEGGA